MRISSESLPEFVMVTRLPYTELYNARIKQRGFYSPLAGRWT